MNTSEAPTISIVIPIFNEEEILVSSVRELSEGLEQLGWSWELILAENGSTDRTVELAALLADEFSQISAFSVDEPNYGRALREGILRARGTYVICDEIDLCDLAFYTRAMPLLLEGHADMVIGSKAMMGARDERPPFRRLATRVMSGLLRISVGFTGTDTHGLKAFRRDRMLPLVEKCVVENDLFASEFVVRAGRSDRTVIEIPVRVNEKRRPATHLVRRVPNVLLNLARLTYVIRVKR